tara:strand:- start:266 stop:502 length:237 start_codon:yes stop_codon:yes gene_type:complete
MAFKMNGWSGNHGSAFNKAGDPPKKETAALEKSKAELAALKQKLYNMDDPNSTEGQNIQNILDKAGVEWRGPNVDEID